MKTTTIGDASRRSPSSCVTQSMVMPSLAEIHHRVQDLLDHSDRAEVGSSNSMIFGFMHRARAIATRCCCPPESCAGYFAACSGMRHPFQDISRRLSASCLGETPNLHGTACISAPSCAGKVELLENHAGLLPDQTDVPSAGGQVVTVTTILPE